MSGSRSSSTLSRGDMLPGLRFGPVTRAFLARYAAASGDFNPIHVDSDFASAGGHPDVFAHGMLSFGLAGRLVSEWTGTWRLTHLSARFTAITRVGDVILMEGRVAEVTSCGEAVVDILATAEGGAATLVARAILEPL